MKLFLATFAVTLLTAGFKPVASNPVAGGDTKQLSGKIVVGFRSTSSKGDATNFITEKLQEAQDEGLADCNTEAVYESEGGDGGFQVFDVGEGNEDLVMKKLKSGMNHFAYVQPDYIVSADDTTPNDEKAELQYTLNKLSLYDAWDISTGISSVTIGVCDTGIDLDHEDLFENMLEGYNAITQTWGGDVSTTYNQDHGTMVAGAAAAVTNNGIGVAGMGWTLKHRAGQVQTSPGYSRSSVIADCIRKMCQKSDVKVVNVSFSGVYDAARYAVARECRKYYDTLVVNSAGNWASPIYPIYGDADLDSIIFVGATDSDDNPAYFSNYGDLVDVWAPGLQILTTRDNDVVDYLYSEVSGTSFSAPIVAGLIGLIWSINPDLTPDEVEAMLKDSCDQLDSLDGLGGHGRVNALKALQLATGTTTLSPTSAPECEEEVELEFVTDEWPTENLIYFADGMDVTPVIYGDSCYTKYTDTLSGLCTDTNYNVFLSDSYGDGWHTCGGGGFPNSGCSNSCQPPYLKGTWNGQTLFHLTGFYGGYVQMDFTLKKEGKSSKATKRGRVRARR